MASEIGTSRAPSAEEAGEFRRHSTGFTVVVRRGVSDPGEFDALNIGKCGLQRGKSSPQVGGAVRPSEK
jgi:hypothetical protein